MSLDRKTSTDLAGARREFRERKARLLERFGEVTELALDEARRALKEGRPSDARNLLVCAGVSADKSLLLAGEPTSLTRSEVDTQTVTIDRERVLALFAEVSKRTAKPAVSQSIEAKSVVATPVEVVEAPGPVGGPSEPEPSNPRNGDRWAGRTFDARFGWVDDGAGLP